jgi:hypothetical protein
MPGITDSINSAAELFENIPLDARQFFSQAMKQKKRVDFPEHVSKIMQQYNYLWGEEIALQ